MPGTVIAGYVSKANDVTLGHSNIAKLNELRVQCP